MPRVIKALSVRQPWARLIAAGIKTLEVRSRHTHYRGELLICSSLSAPAHAQGPRGMALATVRLVNCRPFTPADVGAACVNYAPDLFVWKLTDAHPLPRPFPVKGSLNFFEVFLPAT